MDFSDMRKVTIPEGVVEKIHDKDGNLLWSSTVVVNINTYNTTVTGNGEYESGSEVSITIQADDGYCFGNAPAPFTGSDEMLYVDGMSYSNKCYKVLTYNGVLTEDIICSIIPDRYYTFSYRTGHTDAVLNLHFLFDENGYVENTITRTYSAVNGDITETFYYRDQIDVDITYTSKINSDNTKSRIILGTTDYSESPTEYKTLDNWLDPGTNAYEYIRLQNTYIKTHVSFSPKTEYIAASDIITNGLSVTIANSNDTSKSITTSDNIRVYSTNANRFVNITINDKDTNYYNYTGEGTSLSLGVDSVTTYILNRETRYYTTTVQAGSYVSTLKAGTDTNYSSGSGSSVTITHTYNQTIYWKLVSYNASESYTEGKRLYYSGATEGSFSGSDGITKTISRTLSSGYTQFTVYPENTLRRNIELSSAKYVVFDFYNGNGPYYSGDNSKMYNPDYITSDIYDSHNGIGSIWKKLSSNGVSSVVSTVELSKDRYPNGITMSSQYANSVDPYTSYYHYNPAGSWWSNVGTSGVPKVWIEINNSNNAIEIYVSDMGNAAYLELYTKDDYWRPYYKNQTTITKTGTYVHARGSQNSINNGYKWFYIRAVSTGTPFNIARTEVKYWGAVSGHRSSITRSAYHYTQYGGNPTTQMFGNSMGYIYEGDVHVQGMKTSLLAYTIDSTHWNNATSGKFYLFNYTN